MSRWILAIATTLSIVAPIGAAGLTGTYIEARTCDVWTAPCFANADMNLGGKHAVLGWKVDKGSWGDVNLNGLSIVAVISASDTLGLEQTGPARAVLIVDQKATAVQRDALVKLAKYQGGDLVRNVLTIQTAPVDLTTCECTGGTCAKLEAGANTRIETRCIDQKHDKACGNEKAFYPPLSRDVTARVGVAVEHRFSGKDLNETWKDIGRRGAYVGSFEIK